MYQTKDEQLLKVAENILAFNPAMRFAAILDLRGNIIEGIMKDRKTSLESQKQQEKIDKALKEINELIKFYDKYVEAGYTISPNRLSTILQHLKEIKKTLEK